MKISKILAGSITATLLSSALLASGGGSHWGYTGHEAPANWGDLSADYSLCKDGKNQSPININKSVTIESGDLQKINFDYKTSASDVVNNGHTIQVNIKDGSSIKIDGITFSLKQFHFHTPSENQIDGKNFPLEAHFVHASAKGELAVVALMLEDGKENSIIKKIWNKMPHKAGSKAGCGLPSNLINNLLPKGRDYYRFTGSLTTPPCSEGVRWMVLKDYASISKAQVKEFLDIFHHANNRPVQPINARKVMK